MQTSYPNDEQFKAGIDALIKKHGKDALLETVLEVENKEWLAELFGEGFLACATPSMRGHVPATPPQNPTASEKEYAWLSVFDRGHLERFVIDLMNARSHCMAQAEAHEWKETALAIQSGVLDGAK